MPVMQGLNTDVFPRGDVQFLEWAQNFNSNWSGEYVTDSQLPSISVQYSAYETALNAVLSPDSHSGRCCDEKRG